MIGGLVDLEPKLGIGACREVDREGSCRPDSQRRIEQQGSPAEVYARPRSEFVGGFVGSPAMNLLDGIVANGRLVAGAIGADGVSAEEGAFRVGIRPEEIVLASSVAADERAATFEATVELIEAIGPRSVVSLVAASGPAMTAVVEARSATALREGASARFAVRHDALHFFPARHED